MKKWPVIWRHRHQTGPGDRENHVWCGSSRLMASVAKALPSTTVIVGGRATRWTRRRWWSGGVATLVWLARRSHNDWKQGQDNATTRRFSPADEVIHIVFDNRRWIFNFRRPVGFIVGGSYGGLFTVSRPWTRFWCARKAVGFTCKYDWLPRSR